MVNPVKSILRYNAGRDPERLAIKYQAMRADPFTFLRGSCHLFYARLPSARVLHNAPRAWLCGDAHLENFGSYKGDNRLVYFDLNDFDEAALAPVSWDIVRLVASLHVAADRLHLADAAPALEAALLEAYGAALAAGKPRWIERDVAHGLIGELLQDLRGRQRQDFLDKRTVLTKKRRQLVVDGKRCLPVTAAQRQKVGRLVAAFAAGLPHPGFYEVLDVARRIAGTGSLGVERYVVLVQGKGSPDQNYLLDLKQALPSSLSPALAAHKLMPVAGPAPAWSSEAQRVRVLQSQLQAVPMAFLHALERRKTSYLLKGLQASQDRVTIAGASTHATAELLKTMGQLLAWAHLRSAGFKGADSVDALMAYGRDRARWQPGLLAKALACADQTVSDWKQYAKAYDEGAFALS